MSWSVQLSQFCYSPLSGIVLGSLWWCYQCEWLLLAIRYIASLYVYCSLELAFLQDILCHTHTPQSFCIVWDSIYTASNTLVHCTAFNVLNKCLVCLITVSLHILAAHSILTITLNILYVYIYIYICIWMCECGASKIYVDVHIEQQWFPIQKPISLSAQISSSTLLYKVSLSSKCSYRHTLLACETRDTQFLFLSLYVKINPMKLTSGLFPFISFSFDLYFSSEDLFAQWPK